MGRMCMGALGLITLLAAALQGCAAHGGGLAMSGVRETGIEGTWRAESGMIAQVEHEGGDRYGIELRDPGRTEEREYDARVLRIEGALVVETLVIDANRQRGDVFVFTRVLREGDRLTYFAIREDWLSGYAARHPELGDRVVRLGDGPSVALSVGDPAAQEAMLRAALRDPGAWRSVETWTLLTAADGATIDPATPAQAGGGR